jgi:hypothetical protein
MSTNRISVSIPDDVILQVSTALNQAKTLLQPYLQSLKVDERHDLPKMSDKSFGFVSKVNDYCTSNPEFNPAFSDSSEFKKDFELVATLKPLFSLCEQLCGNIDDTMMLAGSEAYQAALLYYGSVQVGAKTGQPNAKSIAEDLSNRFPGRRKKKVDAEPAAVKA